jgi:molybdopterin-binding protein
MLRGTITANRDGIVNVEVGDWLLEGISNFDVGTNVTACIRPEAITLSTEQTSTSARNSFYGTINAITASGPVTHVTIDCGIPILATVTSKSSDEMNLAEGTLVSAIFKATAVHILPN